MERRKRVGSGGWCSGLLVAMLAFGCDKTSAEQGGPQGNVSKQAADIECQLLELAPVWEQAAQAADAAQIRPCDEQKVKALIGSGAAKAVAVTTAQLRAVSIGARMNPTPPQSFFTTKKFDSLNFSPKSDEQAILGLSHYNDFKAKFPLLAVISIKGFTPPAAKGDQFVAGSFKAAVSLIPTGQPMPLCTGAVIAESATEVAKRDGESTEEALLKDFEYEITKHLKEAISQLSAQVSL